MKIGIVCGNWDYMGGLKSEPMALFAKGVSSQAEALILFNGGLALDINLAIEKLRKCDVIIWAATVGASTPRTRNLKGVYPDKILVVAKDNSLGMFSKKDIMYDLNKANADFILETGFSVSGHAILSIYNKDGQSWMDPTADYSEAGEAIYNIIKSHYNLVRINRIKSRANHAIGIKDVEKVMKFLVCWDDGRDEELTGIDIDDAVFRAGYDANSVLRINSFSEVNN